jgi:hypothetical protein
MKSQDKTILEQLHEELHDICQPLTSLQCRLEVSRLIGGEQALGEAVMGALEDTRRMFELVGRMRQRLHLHEADIQQYSAK